MTKKRLAALLMAVLLCISCMNVGYAECEAHWTEWISDDFHHEKYCSMCTESEQYGGHSYDENGYCPVCEYQCTHSSSKNGVCEYCGVVTCEHEFNDEGVCTKCQAKCEHKEKDYEEYTDELHRAHCAVCLCVINEKHTYKDGVCTLCDHECGHSSYKDGECEYCGAECNHVYGTNGFCTKCNTECEHEWDYGYYDSYNHEKYCDICGKTEYEAHGDLSYVENEHSPNSYHVVICGICEDDFKIDGQHEYQLTNGQMKCTLCDHVCTHEVVNHNEYSDESHAVNCDDCFHQWTEKHTYENGVCSICDYVCGHSSYNNGECEYCGAACMHELRDYYGNCENCGFTCDHSFDEDHTCTLCNWTCGHQAEIAVGWIDEKQHKTECQVCGWYQIDYHDFSDGECGECYYECDHDAGFDEDGLCKNCHSTCKHKSVCCVDGGDDAYHDMICEICHEWVEEGDHRYEDGVCWQCDHVCNHSERDSEGDCGICDFTCEHTFNNEYVCTKCNWACEHAFIWTKMQTSLQHAEVCEICDKKFTFEDHSFSDGYCSECDYKCTHPNGYNDEYKCVICGQTCEHKGMLYQSCDEECHDGECQDCGYTVTEEKHNYVNSKCTLCGYECIHHVFDDKGECQICDFVCSHNGGIYYDKSRTGHDKICSICDSLIETSSHTFNEDHICSVCEYECQHESIKDGVCPDCEFVCTHTSHDKETCLCTICGAKCEHNYVASSSGYLTYHNLTCSVCGATSKESHHYVNSVCELCDYVCQYHHDIFVTIDPTETEIGYRNQSVCEYCGRINFIGTPIPPTNYSDLFGELDEDIREYCDGFEVEHLDEIIDIMEDKLKYNFSLTLGENIETMMETFEACEADVARAAVDFKDFYSVVDQINNPTILALLETDTDSIRWNAVVTYINRYPHEGEATVGDVKKTYEKLARDCTQANAVDEAAGDSTDPEIVKLVEDYYAEMLEDIRTTEVPTGYKDFTDLTNETIEKIKARIETLQNPVVNDVKSGTVVNAGTPAWFTVKTTTNTASLKLLTESMGTAKTWTNGYTDEGDVRTWEISYNFLNAGQRTLYFQPVAADSTKGEAYRVGINVFDNAIVNTVWYDGEIIASKAEHFTVTTSTNATALTLYAENKGEVKTWTKYADKNGQRTWEIDYTFANGGDRHVYFAAANRSNVYGSMFGVDMKVIVLPTVKSAAFAAGAMAGNPVSITVKTSTDATKLEMLTEAKAVAKTWTSGYTDANGVRTWTVSYSFINAGTRNLYFRVANKNGVYSDMVAANVTVAKKVETKTATFTKVTAKVGEAVTITVKTGTNAKKLGLCAENGVIYGSWNAEGNSKIVGSERVWTVTYKFATAGNRNIGFKASEDGKTWGAAVSSKITITK